MGSYSTLVRPFLFACDSERIHHRAMDLMQTTLNGPVAGLLGAGLRVQHAALEQTLWGRRFANPVGLAAGFDKNAVAIEPLAALGFGHIEVGTITAQAQPGNPTPRLFRLRADSALINRMGFNNLGAAAVAQQLAQRYDPAGGVRRPRCVLGINLGKSKVTPLEAALADYQTSVQHLGKLADYVVVNVSSPNTPGLRDLQGEAALRPLLVGVRSALDRVAPGTPLLLKIAPDLADAGIDAAVDVALEAGCNGLIATNTTISRSGLRSTAERVTHCGAGGLSGLPLRQRSTAVLARVARRVQGRVPVLGVGGVFTAEDAWEKISHGASLVQVYTGFIYQGPLIARKISQGLLALLARYRLPRISDAVGRAL